MILQILRKDYVSGQKQWEEEQVKAAPQPPVLPEDEEMELKTEVSRSEGLLAACVHTLGELTEAFRC